MARNTTELYDALVLGAGPAGATAATVLARHGRRVCLVDAAGFPREAGAAGWISAPCVSLLAELDIAPKDFGARPFKSVAFFDADLAKFAHPEFAEPAGFIVNRAKFGDALVKMAAAAGVEVRSQTRVREVVLGERQVTLKTDDSKSSVPVQGRLLVFSAGRGTPLLTRLGVSMDTAQGGSWAAQIESDDPPAKGDAAVSIIFGLDRTGGFGIIMTAKGLAAVGIQSASDRRDVIPNLVSICRLAREKGLIDVDLTRQAAAANVTVSPTAVALSMDTHVTKHTLIVGDAGGFVAAASGEGIYPGMWSARIAADVIHRALDAPSPQDALMEFDAAWRTKMADYLRAPNSDAQYILPLVFSNQPMANRMGAAFFAGENI